MYRLFEISHCKNGLANMEDSISVVWFQMLGAKHIEICMKLNSLFLLDFMQNVYLISVVAVKLRTSYIVNSDYGVNSPV